MFEFLFKYPASAFAKGKLVWLSGWPLWLLGVALVLGAAGLAWFWWRRRESLIRGYQRPLLWALQWALLALLLIMLWQPALSLSTLKSQQNIIAVIVDDSKSMATPESGGTRTELTRQALGGLLDTLSRQYQVRLYRASQTIERASTLAELKSNGPATRLGDALAWMAMESSNLPIGAVVLASDGAESGGGLDQGALQQLRSRGLPVHTLGVGREQFEKDVEVVDAAVPLRALQDSRLNAVVSFRQRGFAGQKGKLVVREAGRVLAAQDFTFKADGSQQTESVLFQAGPAGAKTLAISVEPMAGEEHPANNHVTRVLQVNDQRLRVLYVEGEPRWEYKFIRRALEDDKSIEVVSLLRTSQNKFYRQGIKGPTELEAGFPAKTEELFEYHAVVIGSVEAAWFTPAQQEALRQFADRRGGGVLFLAGRASLADGGYGRPPFAEMLPVTLPDRKNTFVRDPATAELTLAGRDSLICRLEEGADKNLERWKKLPYMAGYQDAGTPKPGALVLAEMTIAGKTRLPLLITQNYGRGRTAILAGAGTWRWQMLQPLEDLTHEMFWQQLLRWTVTGTPTRVVGSASETMLYDNGRVKLRADVRDPLYAPAAQARVAVRVLGPDGRGQDVEMQPAPNEAGIFEADFNAAAPGSYVAEFIGFQGKDEGGRDAVTFRREDGAQENFRRELNRDLLEKLAQQTGGSYRAMNDAAGLAKEISFSEAGLTVRENRELWNMPVLFLLALLLRASEWLLRRRWGVV